MICLRKLPCRFYFNPIINYKIKGETSTEIKPDNFAQSIHSAMLSFEEKDTNALTDPSP